MTEKKEKTTATVEKAVEKKTTPIVSKDKLLEAGAYFGHK
ncbi:30S ribosomal protein S2, partial [Mycoplasmopsis pullorum]